MLRRFSPTHVDGRRGTSGLDEDGNVALSSARRGQIIYTFDDEDVDADNDNPLEGTDPMKAKEWNELEITFTWEAGEPALDIGTVTVSYHPVTDDLTKMSRPRYMPAAPPTM